MIERMTEQLARLVARIDALSLRERLLSLVAALAIIAALWNVALMSPLAAEQELRRERMSDLRSEIDGLNEQAQEIAERGARSPDRRLRQAIRALKQDIAELDERLGEITTGLIDPRDMPRVLEQVLTRETGLELVRLQNRGARPLLDPRERGKAEGEPAPSAQIFRHELELVFRGEYLQTLSYLRALDELPWRLFWRRLELDVVDHPMARVRIVVFTLGLREGWIGV